MTVHLRDINIRDIVCIYERGVVKVRYYDIDLRKYLSFEMSKELFDRDIKGSHLALAHYIYKLRGGEFNEN